jgi:hypothetical protein
MFINLRNKELRLISSKLERWNRENEMGGMYCSHWGITLRGGRISYSKEDEDYAGGSVSSW